ncbi:MAG TPA: hypothetical protein VHJ18_27900 [Streptosporangiaceae bacterium]|nr:hypothetical protein [Streptosporangiaceae bacterium]
MAGVAALAVILIAAGIAVALSARAPRNSAASSGGPGSSAAPASSQSPASSQPSPRISVNPAVVTANQAARWVEAQVSHAVIVACDKAMCDALAAAGFPGRHLKHIWPDAAYPRHVQVVVVTPTVERQFGVKRNAEMAPPVLAEFGTGNTAITIRVVAPHGAAKLRHKLTSNQRQLRSVGTALLKGRHVTASPLAKNLLLAGRVDPRLIVVLTAVASVHPIDIVSFNANAPGISPGIQYRTADLAPNDPAARMSGTDYLRFLLTALNAEPGIYHPLVAAMTHNSAGQPVFRITFAAPSPLNLLGG